MQIICITILIILSMTQMTLLTDSLLVDTGDGPVLRLFVVCQQYCQSVITNVTYFFVA